MAESKYGKYILREARASSTDMPPKDMRNIGISEELMEKIGKYDINFNFVGILRPHMLADPPHDHDCDEFLFFIPADSGNWPDLGGEAEVALGEEWEKHIIDTAAVICLPPGVPHAPIFMRKVNRPFYFGHCLLAPRYRSSETIAQEKAEAARKKAGAGKKEAAADKKKK
jgi:hypothetical protein